MIFPTIRAILLMLAGVPLMIFIAIAAPSLWIICAGWIFAVAGLVGMDALLGARITQLKISSAPPSVLYVGSSEELDVELSYANGPLPKRVEVKLETDPFLEPIPELGLRGWDQKSRPYAFALKPTRRGTTKIDNLWLRWKGPLGLVQKVVKRNLNFSLPILPNIKWVKEEAIRIYSRDAEFGIKLQIDRGDGSEFDALREFTSGMDRRAIDWKHSARHKSLLAKEFRTERNHNIIFAFDTGRLMCEPLQGIPKIDHAINAGLLLSFVSLRNGDKTMVFGFDERPGTNSGFMMGSRAFPKVQQRAAELDYSHQETNFTLALSQLRSRLERRSLIIIFSDFVDTISAELMLENVRRLMDRHLVIFATFEDETLSAYTDRAPSAVSDFSQAVVSDVLLTEREIVLRRLQRMGVQIIEAKPEHFSADLISRYLQIKQRDML